MAHGRICPHCNEPLKLPPAPEANTLTYGKSSLTVTECCGYAVTLHRVQGVRIEPHYGPKGEDDWGKPIKAKQQPRTLGEVLADSSWSF